MHLKELLHSTIKRKQPSLEELSNSLEVLNEKHSKLSDERKEMESKMMRENPLLNTYVKETKHIDTLLAAYYNDPKRGIILHSSAAQKIKNLEPLSKKNPDLKPYFDLCKDFIDCKYKIHILLDKIKKE